jgi:predicted nicotinamide N-methyase
MPGYQTKLEQVAISGVDDLCIRSLVDRQQFCDPLGAAERLGISSASWPLFGLIWPSGSHLAARLALRPVRSEERILEIGCGLALASLVGHRRGADVTASDCHPLAEAFLLENLRLNRLRPMKYRHGHWSPPVVSAIDEQALAQCVVTGRYDLILGSDLLYERDERGSLAHFIASHAAPSAEIWIVDPDRGNRAGFHRHMLSLGFAGDEQRYVSARAASAGATSFRGRMLTYRRTRAFVGSGPRR